MITVFQILSQRCQAKGLSAPVKNDMIQAGNIVAHHFKKFWVPKKCVPGEPIKGAGFLFEQQGEAAFVCNAYPEAFKDEMIEKVDLYLKTRTLHHLSDKAQKVPVKKERKKIPAGAEKVFSSKKN